VEADNLGGLVLGRGEDDRLTEIDALAAMGQAATTAELAADGF
jgi:hypothetical protein